jgi:tRNA (guanine10-N2)-methyltransferase
MGLAPFLVRFVQQHASFRVSELASCAVVSNCGAEASLKYLEYDDSSPFAVLLLENEKVAAAMVERSILTQYNLLWVTALMFLLEQYLSSGVVGAHMTTSTLTWFQKQKPDGYLADVALLLCWRGQDHYKHCSFRFKFDAFNHTRSMEEQTAIIETFAYMEFEGPVQLRNPEQLFVVHELWSEERPRKLLRLYLGRYVRIRPFPQSLCLVGCQRQSRPDDKVWFEKERLRWQHFIRCRVITDNCQPSFGMSEFL